MRLRVTLGAVLIVGAALVGGAVVLVALLGSVLTGQVCSEVKARAAVVAAAAEVPLSSADELVRVVDATMDAGPADPGKGCVKAEPPGYGEDLVFAAADGPA